MPTIANGTKRKIVLFKAGVANFMKAEGEAFRKDFIREGTWRLPDGTLYPVDKARIDVWEKNFKLFRERGISVPLTVDHIQTAGGEIKKLTPAMAEAKRGEVVNLFRDGDLGIFDAKPADKEAETLMLRCPEVSLEEERDVVDSEGNYYEAAITAITLTPIPVIPGQGSWEKVHLSKGDSGNTVYLSAEPLTATEAKKQPPVQEKKTMFTPAQLSRAKQSLGLVDSTPDQEVEIAMLAHVESNNSGKITTLSRRVQELESSQGAQQLDEEAADALIASYETRIEKMTLTPAQKTELSKLVKAQKDKRSAVFLSKRAGEKQGLDSSVIDTVLKVFEAGKPEEMAALLKEVSGKQRTELSKSGAGHEDAPAFDPKLAEAMANNQNARLNATTSNTVL